MEKETRRFNARGKKVRIGDKVYKSINKAADDCNMDAKTFSYRVKKGLLIKGEKVEIDEIQHRESPDLGKEF